MRRSKAAILALLCAGFYGFAWAESPVTAPAKAAADFKEVPARRGPASEPSTPPPQIKAMPEITDSETEAGFCIECAKISVTKTKSITQQSEEILKVLHKEDSP